MPNLINRIQDFKASENARGYSYRRRKILHIVMGGFALLLKYTTLWQAILLALGGFLFNRFIVPCLGGLRITHHREKGYDRGLLAYPIAILILVLVFHQQRHIVAATWAILALGDGFASLLGYRFGVRRLPWNAQKSYVGFCSFALFGSAGAVLFTLWIAWGDPALTRLGPLLLVVPMTAALFSALIETLPIPIDDNFSVAFTAATVMYWLYRLLG